jgi:very-short-patch-repair endonuclease
MTEEELILWSRLKNRQLGVKFLRQRSIGPYVGDFVSIEAGLVIELDGSQHFDAHKAERDSDRTDYLSHLGFRVIRFGNHDIRGNLSGVLQVIQENLRPEPPL